MIEKDEYFKGKIIPIDAGVKVIILTRFNLAIGGFRRKNHDHAEWFARRMGEFRTACLPSVAGQERRPDQWLLGLDGAQRETASPLEPIFSEHDWIMPAWQHPGQLYPFDSVIEAHLKPETHTIITIRLDNDDALHLGYVRQLLAYWGAVAAAKPTLSDAWLSFCSGAQYDGKAMRLINNVTNPFVARAVSRSVVGKGGYTVYATSHQRTFDRMNGLKIITRDPMWLMNIHGTNVSNRMADARPRLAADELLPAFGIGRSE